MFRFPRAKPIIGMLHAPALPGAPHNSLNLPAILDHLRRDAQALLTGGVDALMLENFHDVPFYPGPVPPHVVASLTALALAVRSLTNLPLGINVLRNDGRAALAVAHAAGAQFIRVNVLCGARVTDQGLITGIAHDLLRDRAALNARHIAIFADVQVKHSAPLGAERPLADDVADTIHRGLADALILTGSATGAATSPADLQSARPAAGKTPIFIGSGVTPATIAQLAPLVDGFIVGTALKSPNHRIDVKRVRRLVAALRAPRALDLPHRNQAVIHPPPNAARRRAAASYLPAAIQPAFPRLSAVPTPSFAQIALGIAASVADKAYGPHTPRSSVFPRVPLPGLCPPMPDISSMDHHHRSGPHRDRRDLTRFLLLLWAGDVAFIAVHLIHTYTPCLRSEAYGIAAESGFAETYQYLKTFWVVLLCAALFRRTRTWVYLGWLLVFLYTLCDDMFVLHEYYGREIYQHFHWNYFLHLHPWTWGELTIWAAAGAILAPIVAAGYRFSPPAGRHASQDLVFLFAALVFCGMGLDALHGYMGNARFGTLLVILEDGGEMVCISALCAYLFALAAQHGHLPAPLWRKAAAHLHLPLHAHPTLHAIK